jgi:hypothetical protein
MERSLSDQKPKLWKCNSGDVIVCLALAAGLALFLAFSLLGSRSGTEFLVKAHNLVHFGKLVQKRNGWTELYVLLYEDYRQCV